MFTATLSAAARREVRQFTVLARGSVRQLLASVTAARDADPMQLALWGAALALTPPFLMAVRKIIAYPVLLRAPAHVVERILLADRVFFVLYGMLATMLLAALVWDALTPTRQDQDILGVLPVRPRTVAAARFTAAVGLALAFALTVNGPAAVVYSLASSVHPLVGSFPRVLLAHLTATTLACLATFLTLLSVRALMTVLAGDRMAARVAVVLQVVTFVLLVETFFFLPVVLPALMNELLEGGSTYGAWPPLWFTALFNQLAEGRLAAPELVARASTLALLAAAGATALALLPARWMARRTMETLPKPSASWLGSVMRHVAHAGPLRAESRALFLFAVASLTRSQRHALVLGTYLGLAIATALVGVASSGLRGPLSFDVPQAPVLAVPLIAIFFAVLGLRAACRIPVDVDANWPMRLRQPAVGSARHATRMFILTLGVAPVVITWAAVSAALWGATVATSLAWLDTLAGILLTEVALLSWTRVPFATSHEPVPDLSASRWLGIVAGLLMFGFGFANMQVELLRSDGALASVGLACLTAIAAVALQGHRLARGVTITLDAPSDAFEGLRLSPAND
jgi:hypothetical protein